MFREFGARRELAARTRAGRAARTVRNAERKALHELGLEEGAEQAEIKARFKILVKRHHPDANGGDRAIEDKLREIIQAYNYLKSTRRLSECEPARRSRMSDARPPQLRARCRTRAARRSCRSCRA